MTNIEKFEEVFGFIPDMECVAPTKTDEEALRACTSNPYEGCFQCPYYGWWEKEYTGKKII